MELTTMQVLGRPFSVTSAVKADGLDAGTVRYTFTGPRSAVYVTFRNVNTPHLMFLVNKRTGGVVDGVWFSDESGELRPVVIVR